MLVPILVTAGVLGALYATRGPVRSVTPNHWYLIGMREAMPGGPLASAGEIEAARAFVQALGFKNVTHAKTTNESGTRIYWFKGLWSGTETALRPDSPVKVYEVLG